VHTVKRAAEQIGISPDTLRAWERRYAVVEPRRTPGGYRLYDEGALRRLAAMKALVDQGWSPAQAAERALRDALVLPDRVKPTKGRESPASAEGDTESLVRAGRDLDGEALRHALDQGFAIGSFERALEHWLLPSLSRLGDAWTSGELGIAGEHFVSAGVQRRLATSFEAAGHPGNGPAVLVGLAPGSRHELGVLAFAVALRRLGVPTTYVGADVPAQSWVEVAETERPPAVVLGVPTVDDVPMVREVVDALAAVDPALPVLLGGAHQDGVGGPAQPLGHSITGGAARVAAVV
jgi:methanogenic corrinoid protein MtbC1